jgi:hypothetical protein
MDLFAVYGGVHERYRRRFQIESRYRLRETGRARARRRDEGVVVVPGQRWESGTGVVKSPHSPRKSGHLFTSFASFS